MATVPNPSRISVGAFADDIWLNTLVDAASLALGSQAAGYYCAAGQSFSINTWATVGLDTKMYDIDRLNGLASWSGAHPSRLVFNYPGLYDIIGICSPPAASGGERHTMIKANANGVATAGTWINQARELGSTVANYPRAQGRYRCTAAGQYVELFFNSSTTAGSLIGTAGYTALHILLVSA